MKRTTTGIPPWSMAVASMVLIQLSSTSSLVVSEQVGTAGVAWLRMVFGSLLLIAIARPPLRSLRRADILPIIVLGTASAFMTLLFLQSITRIPIGTAVAIEFLGPLVVAAAAGRRASALAWPALAFVGVVLLNEPWHGELDLIGIAYAAGAGVAWGVYIVFTQRLGDRFSGISALSLTIPVGAVVTGIFGLPEMIGIGHFAWWAIPAAAGIALLMPVLSFGLEMLALKRMTQSAFGTLAAVEPAIASLAGVVLLHQWLEPLQIAGLVCVVGAGIMSQRGGLRGPRSVPGTSTGPIPQPGPSTGPIPLT